MIEESMSAREALQFAYLGQHLLKQGKITGSTDTFADWIRIAYTAREYYYNASGDALKAVKLLIRNADESIQKVQDSHDKSE